MQLKNIFAQNNQKNELNQGQYLSVTCYDLASFLFGLKCAELKLQNQVGLKNLESLVGKPERRLLRLIFSDSDLLQRYDLYHHLFNYLLSTEKCYPENQNLKITIVLFRLISELVSNPKFAQFCSEMNKGFDSITQEQLFDLLLKNSSYQINFPSIFKCKHDFEPQSVTHRRHYALSHEDLCRFFLANGLDAEQTPLSSKQKQEVVDSLIQELWDKRQFWPPNTSKEKFKEAVDGLLEAKGLRQSKVKFEDQVIFKITSTPSGADVLIGGKKMGKTPFEKPLEADGLTKTIIVSKVGYEDHIERFKFISGGYKSIIEAKLEVKPFSLNVKSSPPEVDVLINGIKIGKTPLKKLFDEADGKSNTVILRKKGYEDYQEMIIFNPGEKKKLLIKLNDKAKGLKQSKVKYEDKVTFKITSTPSDADVLIDGKKIGNTPFEKPLVADGDTKTIIVSKAGFKDHIEQFEFISGGSKSIEAKLEVKPFSLNVESTPPKANVFINRRKIGETPLKKLFEADGESRIVSLSKKGYEGYQEQIKFNPDEKRKLQIKLKDKPKNSILKKIFRKE